MNTSTTASGNGAHEKHRNVLGFLDDEGESEVRESYESHIQFYLSDKVIERKTYQLITAEPKMPDIRLKPQFADSENTDIKMRIKIEYTKIYNSKTIRQDSVLIPNNEWYNVKGNDIWDVDFGEVK